MAYTHIFNDISQAVLPVLLAYRQDCSRLKTAEKPDCTLVTQADFKVQRIVIDTIRAHMPGARFIAEEDGLAQGADADGRTAWVIDPIDGTKPFTQPDQFEYCCAVCAIEDGMPAAAMLLMPQLGIGCTPLTAVALAQENKIYINANAVVLGENTNSRYASATRSEGSAPSDVEVRLTGMGYTIKHRTTSQSIGLLRTALDLSAYTQPQLCKFELFYRQSQKLWDGAAGLLFNIIAGNRAVDAAGRPLLPFPRNMLAEKTPTLAAALIGSTQLISKLTGE